MTRRRADVAVLGGGPAGAACALSAARRGLAVALFEPQGGAIDKPCGEGILPEGVQALRELGLEEAVLRGRRFERLRYFSPRGELLEVQLEPAGVAVERPELSRALQRAIDSEPAIEVAAERADAAPAEGGFLVRGPSCEVLARTLVVADGAGGRAARWLRGEARARRPRLGVRARFADTGSLDGVEVHLGAGSEVYLTPLPPAPGRGAGVNAAILVDAPPEGLRGAPALVAWALERHPRARGRLGALASEPQARELGHAPPPRTAAPGAFLAGDAAGAVDPILGCGVAIALASGAEAGRACARILAGADPGEVARAFGIFLRREALARRRLAAALQGLAPHPALLAASAALLRRSPALLARMVGIATGG